MSRIHVCALSLIDETARATGAASLITLLSPGTPVARPQSIAADRHLYLSISDIVAPSEGQVLADDAHVRELLDFVRGWDRASPIIIHCYAGVSRSTAAAFITACAINPEEDEAGIARRLRAASPTATPNLHLVALADTLLGREGRMVDAIKAIGRGEECFEGVPFALEIA